MPDGKIVGILTDVGTEELSHLEMIGSILYQLTRNLPVEEIEKSPLASYFTDHTSGIYPASAAGIPTDMKYIGVKGDVLADLNEDLAAEQKARVTYDNLLRMIDDPDVREPLKFLREREIVHYQRFGEPILLFQTDFPCLKASSDTGNYCIFILSQNLRVVKYLAFNHLFKSQSAKPNPDFGI
jgi:spore coat protein JC